MSGPDDSDDDLDARFDALIEENFPGAQTRRRVREFDVPLAPPPAPSLRPRKRDDADRAAPVPRREPRDEDDEPLTVLDAMDRADEADDEGWAPPPARPLGSWPSAIILALLLVLFGLVVGVLGLVGVPVPSILRVVGGVGAVAGLALLLAHALRRQGPPPGDDDGAVV